VRGYARLVRLSTVVIRHSVTPGKRAAVDVLMHWDCKGTDKFRWVFARVLVPGGWGRRPREGGDLTRPLVFLESTLSRWNSTIPGGAGSSSSSRRRGFMSAGGVLESTLSRWNSTIPGGRGLRDPREGGDLPRPLVFQEGTLSRWNSTIPGGRLGSPSSSRRRGSTSAVGLQESTLSRWNSTIPGGRGLRDPCEGGDPPRLVVFQESVLSRWNSTIPGGRPGSPSSSRRRGSISTRRLE